ncbi:MAG: hypothetical protein HYZ53_29710 [Planctomycetes bacterium]|nr:hypothetical protein [Planctomycetota bacterium]
MSEARQRCACWLKRLRSHFPGSTMVVYRRDLRYLTTHLWARWMTMLLVAAPFILGFSLCISWMVLAGKDGDGAVGWFRDGRSMCSLALVLQLVLALSVAVLVSIHIVAFEAREGMLDILRLCPVGSARVFLEKLCVVLCIALPFLGTNAHLLAAAWVYGWMTGPEVLVSLAFSVLLVASMSAVAMTLAVAARVPEVAFPIVFLVAGVLAIGPPPLVVEPDAPLEWLLFSPWACAFRRFANKILFPTTPGEWACAFAWCTAIFVAAVALGSRLLLASEGGVRRRWLEVAPYAGGALAVCVLAVAGWRDVGAAFLPVAVLALVLTLATIGVRLAQGVGAKRAGRRPARSGAGGRGGDPFVGKERDFYETGGLRLLRDGLLLLVCAYALFLAAHPSVFGHATGAVWPLLESGSFLLLLVGVALGATSLTIERSRNTYDLLLLTPLPAERVYRGKAGGILRHVAPLGLATVALAAAAGGPSWRVAAGAVASALCLAPWVAFAVRWGMVSGAGARNNLQAMASCLGAFWLFHWLWGTPNPRYTSWYGVGWNLVKSSLNPFFYGEQAVTFGETLPAWHPLGFWRGLALFALATALLGWGAANLLAVTARGIDPWGEVVKAEKKKRNRDREGAV